MKLGILITAAIPLFAQVPVPDRPLVGRVPVQAPPVQTGTASIEGAVTDSLTHDPIRKSTVTLSGRANLNAVTDAEGHFAFRELPAGQYFVQAQSDRYPLGAFSLEFGRQASVSVAADEHKTGVALTLVPGASLRGRIVDEEGNPMTQCTVSPIRFRAGDANPGMMGASLTQSNEKGEYRIENIAAGKFYLMARCFVNIPMPHPFVRRDALAAVPMLTYAPTFYPSSSELSGATRVSLLPGTDLSGIDFQMTPATGITLRGRVRPVVSGGSLQITLAPKNKRLRPFQQQGARANPTTGEFQIPLVRPGSYELAATATAEGNSYFGRMSVEVNGAAPEPVDLTLAPAPSLTGSLAIEGDSKAALKNLRVQLYQVDGESPRPPPQAEVQSDGSFAITTAPGRWHLQVNGAPGYLKSVTLGDQEVSAESFEIGPAPAALKIVIATKYTQVDATVAGVPADTMGVSGVIWSAGNDLQQNLPLNAQGAVTFSVPPGRYFACAIAAAQPFVLLQDRNFKKALEGHCQSVDAVDGSRTSIQAPFVPADEIKRLADSLDADDAPAF